MICAVIPAFNEARAVGAVVEAAKAVLGTVIVVDDGSTDGTDAVAEAAGAVVVRMARNGGKGAALAAGFDGAVALDAAAAIALDADGQHSPADLQAFLAAYEERRADLIIGARDYSAMPASRRAANRIGQILIRLATGWHMPDNQSGYRLYSRRALQALRPERSDFAAEVEMIVRARDLGMAVEWIPIRTIYADEQSHFRPVHDTAQFLQLVWRLWRHKAQAPDGAVP